MQKSPLRITLEKGIGLLIFFIFLAIVNSVEINNHLAQEIVSFINANVWIILIYTFLFFLAELFEVFIFPFNIPYPIFNAAGAWFLTLFILQIISYFAYFPATMPFGIIFLIIVPIIVLIIGYIKIITRLLFPRSREDKIKSKKENKAKGWKELGEETRLLLMDIVKKLRKEINRKK